MDWIRTFNAQETLFDVGANIGVYSLLAAKAGFKVVAFEPEPQNFAVFTTKYIHQWAVGFNCAAQHGHFQ